MKWPFLVLKWKKNIFHIIHLPAKLMPCKDMSAEEETGTINGWEDSEGTTAGNIPSQERK